MLKERFKVRCVRIAIVVRWCSGYHVCFTRRRSRVRTSLGPFCQKNLFHSLTSFRRTSIGLVFPKANQFRVKISFFFQKKTNKQGIKYYKLFKNIDYTDFLFTIKQTFKSLRWLLLISIGNENRIG